MKQCAAYGTTQHNDIAVASKLNLAYEPSTVAAVPMKDCPAYGTNRDAVVTEVNPAYISIKSN